MRCQAVQHSDQMICEACGLLWDMNDHEPPLCRPRPKVSPLANLVNVATPTSRPRKRYCMSRRTCRQGLLDALRDHPGVALSFQALRHYLPEFEHSALFSALRRLVDEGCVVRTQVFIDRPEPYWVYMERG